MRFILRILGIILLFNFSICYATTYKIHATPTPIISKHVNGPVEERIKYEEKLIPKYFAITFYKPTYGLPYYYTGSPDNTVYRNHTPKNEQIKHAEVKYQFSLKVPAWKNIFNYPSTLFLAYTQLSYWQLYNNRAFMRESDYEPELFLANEINYHLFQNWNINLFNAGLVHQSNGYGTTLQRGWDRFYLQAIASNNNWMVSLKPWYVLSANHNNSDIAKYLGYGQILIGYKCNQHVLALSAHNLIEGFARRATAELTWSFPLTPYLKGYVQVFSGYGQSLIEYNHRTNSAGIGIALSDWL